MSKEPPLFTKLYETVKWIVGRVEMFPKGLRFTLGDRQPREPDLGRRARAARRLVAQRRPGPLPVRLPQPPRPREPVQLPLRVPCGQDSYPLNLDPLTPYREQSERFAISARTP